MLLCDMMGPSSGEEGDGRRARGSGVDCRGW